TTKKTILEVFDQHNKKCEGLVNNGFAEATIVRYKTTRKHLAEFIEETYKRPDLNLSEITTNVVNEFEYFLTHIAATLT
ncbi:MAG: hypothetical protein GX465_17495, partial [Acidobacteria bacterium]|nr:hypothetical protein [Acidobacteriota bacterium]